MYLGIEIGGSKLQVGLGTGGGELLALERADAADGAAAIRQQIATLVERLLERMEVNRGDILGLGVGFGGPVDAATGTVAKSHQVSGWENFPLAAWCRDQLGWRTVVHNDADTAGLAEAQMGAGRGFSPIFYITIGSGIGGGLILDGEIYRGAGRGAAEIGHLLVPDTDQFADAPTSETCSSERWPATVESVCSGWAMARRMQQKIRSVLAASKNGLATERESAEHLCELAGGNLDAVTPEVIAQAARAGNPVAQRHLAVTCRVLGWAVAQMVALVCPQRIVIGGGVSALGEGLLFAPLRNEVARYVFRPFASSYEIVPAAFGEQVVVRGAVCLASQLFGGT